MSRHWIVSADCLECHGRCWVYCSEPNLIVIRNRHDDVSRLLVPVGDIGHNLVQFEAGEALATRTPFTQAQRIADLKIAVILPYLERLFAVHDGLEVFGPCFEFVDHVSGNSRITQHGSEPAGVGLSCSD